MHVPVSLPLKKEEKRCHSSDPDQIQMEFRKECFVNLNIWACARKHAKHQYCQTCKSQYAKYHFQHRCMTFFEITQDSYASASLSLSLSLCLYHLLSKFANSLDPEDLRRLAKPNQGQTGIPRINPVIMSDASKEYN